MIYFIISTPRKSKLSRELLEARLAFRAWIKSQKKRVICFFPRRNRGACVIFNLRSKKELTRILLEWRSFVRTDLDVFPLMDLKGSETLLKKKLYQLQGRERIKHGRTTAQDNPQADVRRSGGRL